MNPFEFLNAINYTKKDLMVDPENEKHYNSFVINRSLSYFPDTVAIANEMNKKTAMVKFAQPLSRLVYRKQR